MSILIASISMMMCSGLVYGGLSVAAEQKASVFEYAVRNLLKYVLVYMYTHLYIYAYICIDPYIYIYIRKHILIYVPCYIWWRPSRKPAWVNPRFRVCGEGVMYTPERPNYGCYVSVSGLFCIRNQDLQQCVTGSY